MKSLGGAEKIYLSLESDTKFYFQGTRVAEKEFIIALSMIWHEKN